MVRLLFVSAKPGLQVLMSLTVIATLTYWLSRNGIADLWVLCLVAACFLVVLVGYHFFPFQGYRPYAFFLLMCTNLVLISGIVYLTGNRDSLLLFLFFTVPIFAAAYYSYPGTLMISTLTAVALFVPFMGGGMYSLQIVSLSIYTIALLLVGFLSCYIVEGEKMYARDSSEYRQLLEISRDKERYITIIYELSRRFSYTLDLDTVLKTTTALARKMLSSEGTLVYLIEDGEAVLKATIGTLPFTDIGAVEFPTEGEWPRQLADGNNVIAEKDDLDWLPLPKRESGKQYSVAAVPLFIGGNIAGYLMCFSSATRGFREFHLDILSTLASQAAVAMEKARLYTRTLSDKMKVETILSTLRDGLLVTDSRGVLVQANPVAERILDFNEPVIGKGLLEALDSSVKDADLGKYTVAEALEAALDGKTIFGEMTVGGNDPSTVQSQFTPLKNHLDVVSGVVLFLHDITELKRVDEMKSNFVSNVSHELRTPLTSILGFASLMLAGRAGPLTFQQKEYLDVVKKQAENLSAMIENLLDLSRIQARGIRASIDEVDLYAVVRSVETHYLKTAEEKGIRLEAKIPGGTPTIAANESRISQVISNLVGNAIKFTPGRGYIEISALQYESFVQVQVADNGTGIPPSAQLHIFDRFYQARSGDSDEQEGFGLGLAICREIVEFHGGRIWVESDPGRGSTFCFTVPVYTDTPRS
ncbi:MAG: GAF domain-containing protein [Verrucomicrobia bacterium]|nr:GAF domain-containing protein [Verrucomicrobiota bacterium]